MLFVLLRCDSSPKKLNRIADYNKDLMRKEQLVEKIIQLQWVEERGAVRTYTEEFIKNIGSYTCPSLKEICTQTVQRRYPQLHKQLHKIQATFCQ